MSSRSKEKIRAAIRKIFRSTRDKNDDDSVEEKTAAANAHAADGVAGKVVSEMDTKADNKTNALKPSAKSEKQPLVTESPGKRPRKSDNKVLPASKLMRPANDLNIRARRLMKEFKEIQRVHNSKQNPVFTVELVDDSLYEWHARLFKIDPDSKLAQDMVELNIPCIVLHLVFPDNFPFTPPFMRVVEPRIEKGYVMEGGAICLELLTARGWASAYTIESLLMQFAASVVKGQGRIARKTRSGKEFNRRTAEEAFRSLVKTHEKYGWVTPALADG